MSGKRGNKRDVMVLSLLLLIDLLSYFSGVSAVNNNGIDQKDSKVSHTNLISIRSW